MLILGKFNLFPIVNIPDQGNRSLVLIEDGEVRWSYESPSPAEIPGANLIFDALSSQRPA